LVTLRNKLVLVMALLLPALLVACGGSGSGSKHTPSSSDATYQAALAEAKQTPVSDEMRAYAQLLCEPVTHFVQRTTELLDEIKAEPTPEGTVSLDDALTQGFAGFAKLKEPFQTFVDDLKEVDPPDGLRPYHQELIGEMDYALRSVDAISENGLAGAFSLPTQEATPVEPDGFTSALVQECGEVLKPFFDDFGGSLFGSGSDGNLLDSFDKTATPPPPGSIGEPLRSGDFELTLHSVDKQYQSGDEFYQPTPGKRYVVVDLSLKNISSESKDYTSFDFKMKDSDNFEYDSTYAGVEHELDGGTLNAGETIRGSVAFELPVDTALAAFSFQPGFFGEGRIDISLR
jgi:hypothetical protein